MSTKPTILYFYKDRIPAPLREMVISSFPEDEFALLQARYSDPYEAILEKAAKADAVFFAPGRHLDDDFFEKNKHLRLMQLWSSGYDKFNVAAATRNGIPVSNNGGANAVSVAEHTLLLLLSVFKRLPDSYMRTAEGRWAGNSHGLDMYTLDNKTVGIIGFGNIGRHFGKLCNAFGATVIYNDITRLDEAEEARLQVSYLPVDEMLACADVVSLHLHLNDDTRGIISTPQIRAMKKGAVLLNVSRAHLIDREPLIEGLESAHLGGAGLDVHYEEPTSPNDPLLTHPSVVCTPHMAGSTVDAYQTAIARSIDNFRRVFSGERPLYQVNMTDA